MLRDEKSIQDSIPIEDSGIPYVELHNTILDLTAKIKELQVNEEKNNIIILEKDSHIETLKRELTKAGQDKEDLKQMHNNYMLQVQTLINQKAIEAPGTKKRFWKFW